MTFFISTSINYIIKKKRTERFQSQNSNVVAGRKESTTDFKI